MNKALGIKNTKTNKLCTPSEAVTKYLRSKPKSKMTAEEICTGINSKYNLKLTKPQVNACLSYFKGTLVNKIDSNGTTNTGRSVSRWAYVKQV